MSPSRCSSLMEANTSTTMPTVCSPSVSQMEFSISPPSTHSKPPCPDPNPDPEPASSPSSAPPGPGPPLPPGPTLQFPCTHSSATPAHKHLPGDSRHPTPDCSLLKSTLGDWGGRVCFRLWLVKSLKSFRISLISESPKKETTQRGIKSSNASSSLMIPRHSWEGACEGCGCSSLTVFWLRLCPFRRNAAPQWEGRREGSGYERGGKGGVAREDARPPSKLPAWSSDRLRDGKVKPWMEWSFQPNERDCN